VPFARRGLVFEPPRVTVLLKLVNDVISNAKSLCLVEFMPQAANQLASAKLLSCDEARRIAAIIAKLPDLLRHD
jgi:hypothetical protein